MNRRAHLVLLLFAGVACTRTPSSGASPGSASAPPTPTAATSAEQAPAVVATPEPAAQASTPTPGGSMSHSTIGVTIEFEPTSRSVLRNQTRRAYWVLHDTMLQPSQLELRDAQGAVVPGFDERATAKFDNTVRKSAFREVVAGGELPLFELRAIQHDELWELRWGPFIYPGLRAGNYTGVVVFESLVHQYFDEETRTKHELSNAWLGTARSDAVAFRLPLH